MSGKSELSFYRSSDQQQSKTGHHSYFLNGFCREANQKGIKFIMDMIVNHYGLNHWWMKDLPMNDRINYYNQTYVETNHKKTILADPYSTQEDKKILVDGWFVPTMPDMNVRNPWLA